MLATNSIVEVGECRGTRAEQLGSQLTGLDLGMDASDSAIQDSSCSAPANWACLDLHP